MTPKQYIEIQFYTKDESKREQIIALLTDEGFDAFEEKEDYLAAFTGYDQFNEKKLAEITLPLQPINYERIVIDEQNWNQQWESGFEPVMIGNFAAVRAAFHAPVKQVKHEIIITPKMSFGTGHHATTYLVIEAMQQLSFNGKTVIDFGTGTGILAILAEKMGAASVWAVDNDDWSISNALENISANQCKNITVKKADSPVKIPKADFILANINLNIILNNLEAISKCCHQGTSVIFSGLLKADEQALLTVLKTYEIELISVTERDNWIALLTTYTKTG